MTIILIASAIIVYRDYHPGDEVSISEWNKCTDISLPASFKIRDKYYGYPDISGDYTTTALYSFNETDYLSVKQKIISDTSYHKNKWLQDADIGALMIANNLSDKDFTIKLSKEIYGEFQIGFIDKSNSILFYTYSYY